MGRVVKYSIVEGIMIYTAVCGILLLTINNSFLILRGVIAYAAQKNLGGNWSAIRHELSWRIPHICRRLSTRYTYIVIRGEWRSSLGRFFPSGIFDKKELGAQAKMPNLILKIDFA